MQVRERTERKLEASGRITPREVLEAYRTTDLKPVTGEFYDVDTGEACALTALGAASGFGERMAVARLGVVADALIDARIRTPWAGDYQDWFICGFDGFPHPDSPLYPPAESGAEAPPFDAAYRELSEDAQRKGWRDGRRAARFVFAA